VRCPSANPWRCSVASVGVSFDNLVRRLRSALLVAGIFAASGVVLLVASPGLRATELRGTLKASELTRPDAGAVEIVDYSWFLPIGESGPAVHRFEGTLTVPRFEMQRSSYSYPIQRFFPGFSVGFVAVDGYLVPSERSIIVSPDNWSLILSPGKVWSEPGDDGLSRASFPFILGSPPDRQFGAGESHNGVATFVFDDTTVSAFRFQITQETAPDGDIYDMWGQVPMAYEPGIVDETGVIASDFAKELADQVLVADWSDLEVMVDSDVLDSFTTGLEPDEISAAGVVVDGVVYLQPSRTRSGDYPYPRYMQHGAASVSKSIGAGVAMLWLAERYGENVFDLHIVDYLDVTADHDGWVDVTFGDVLNMATGVGDNSPDRSPYDFDANEAGPNYRDFYLAETVTGKLDAAFAAGNYSWGPNEIARYTSSQTFVLAAAMDSFLKATEGPDVNLWERLTEEVFRPIGVHHMTMMSIPSDDGEGGVPYMASGLRLTIDDAAKITSLLQNRGAHDGEQLLHPTRTSDALYRSGQLAGLPTGKTFSDGDQAYHASFWSLGHQTDTGTYFQVPFMSGAGGITIFLAPNGVSTFVFTDAGQDAYSLNSPAVAEAIRPYPTNGLGSVSLKPKSLGPVVILLVGTVGLIILVIAGYLAWHTYRKQGSNAGGAQLG